MLVLTILLSNTYNKRCRVTRVHNLRWHGMWSLQKLWMNWHKNLQIESLYTIRAWSSSWLLLDNDLKLNIWNGRLFTQTSPTNAGILFSFPVETILIISKPNKMHDALIPLWKSQITIQKQLFVFSIYPLNKPYQLYIIIIVSPIGMIWEDTLNDSNNWS